MSAGLLEHAKELYTYRHLLMSLTVRDVKVKYRQTLLGVVWAVLQPLAFMAIFTLVFARFGHFGSDRAPYPVFSYAGLLPWTFFATALTLSVTSIANHMSLVKKIYFPREVFSLSVMLASLVDFMIALALFVALALVFGVPVRLHWLWLAWPLAIEMMLITGLGLVASAANVFFRDVKYIVPVAIQIGMFVSPVIYSVNAVPDHLKGWYMLNPMAVVISAFREIVLNGRLPEPAYLWTGTWVSMLILLLSYSVFKRVEEHFADAI